MSKLDFYFFPGTCAQVSHIMLEECELDFRPHVVVVPTGGHKSPEYLTINPSGKVPTLVIDAKPLTETLAILAWLDDLRPGVVLPIRHDDRFAKAVDRSWLAWFGATVHPVFTRFRMPPAIVDNPAMFSAVAEPAAQALGNFFKIASDHLKEREWLLESFSAADVYLFWLWSEAGAGGFDQALFPSLSRHCQQVAIRPAVSRALARERMTMQDLARSGLLPSQPSSMVIEASSEEAE